MYTKLAIEKAIEGGWTLCLDNNAKFEYMDDARGGLWFFDTDGTGVYLQWERVMMDKTFWQSLGKALELEGSTYSWQKDYEEKWLTLWHKLIDHLAEGKDAESFFKNILEK